jgi:hypothetical protein
MNGHPDTISNAAGVNASALADFLALTFKKLKNLGALFVVQRAFVTEGHGALLDRAIKLATRLLTYALFSLLALRLMPEIASRLRYTMYERRWPTVEATFLGRADSFNPEGTSNNSWFWRFCLSPHSPDSVLNFGAAFAIQI